MMLTLAKKVIRASPLWPYILARRHERAEEAWLKAGRPDPPPHSVKVRNILTLADLFGINTLVETGTFKGEMIDATKERFSRIYSIEIFAPLASAASARFAAHPHISIFKGSSDEILPFLLPSITSPALFWLDAHYSGEGTGQGDRETPISRELSLLASRTQPDVIIVDDLREFDANPGYPSGAQLLQAADAHFPGRIKRTMNDALLILPTITTPR